MPERLDLSALDASPLYARMWAAITARCDEMVKATPSRGHYRSAALICADGWSVSSILGLRMADGTTKVYEVSARFYARSGIEVSADGPWVDSRDSQWEKELADRSDAVVIGGEHYRIRPDLPERDRDIAGFAGALHRIRFYSDPEKIIKTRNLWHQGTIPPAFRDRMPDTAEFVRGQGAVNA